MLLRCSCADCTFAPAPRRTRARDEQAVRPRGASGLGSAHGAHGVGLGTAGGGLSRVPGASTRSRDEWCPAVWVEFGGRSSPRRGVQRHPGSQALHRTRPRHCAGRGRDRQPRAKNRGRSAGGRGHVVPPACPQRRGSVQPRRSAPTDRPSPPDSPAPQAPLTSARRRRALRQGGRQSPLPLKVRPASTGTPRARAGGRASVR